MDVGGVASWWGRTPNEPTCHSREKANPTRIDGYVVNPSAMITIHDYEVDKHELIPTHSILRLELSRSSLKEERTNLRKVPSLKAWFENTIKKTSKIWSRRKRGRRGKGREAREGGGGERKGAESTRGEERGKKRGEGGAEARRGEGESSGQKGGSAKPATSRISYAHLDWPTHL